MVVRQSKVTSLATARRKKAALNAATSTARPATKQRTAKKTAAKRTAPARKKAVAKKTAPAPVENTLEAVACHGCGTTVGWASTPHYRVFHAPWCAHYPAVDTRTEERDHLITFLSVYKKVPTKALADSFGLTRQRVQQILAKSA